MGPIRGRGRAPAPTMTCSGGQGETVSEERQLTGERSRSKKRCLFNKKTKRTAPPSMASSGLGPGATNRRATCYTTALPLSCTSATLRIGHASPHLLLLEPVSSRPAQTQYTGTDDDELSPRPHLLSQRVLIASKQANSTTHATHTKLGRKHSGRPNLKLLTVVDGQS